MYLSRSSDRNHFFLIAPPRSDMGVAGKAGTFTLFMRRFASFIVILLLM
jgi:hypothetical protein